jgi:PAS domain S-box-containing protein
MPPRLIPRLLSPRPSVQRSHAAGRYIGAVGATALAAVLAYTLMPWIGLAPLFLVAVVLVSTYAGLPPALLCALLSAVACNILSGQAIGADDLLRLSAFMIGATFVSSLSMARWDAERAAKNANKQLSITLKSIGDAVITTDQQGRVVFMNSIAQSLTGWSNKDATGRSIDEIYHIVDPETRCELETIGKRVLRDNVVLALGEPVQMITRDGTAISIEQVAAPVRNHRGQISGLVVVLRSIPATRVKEANRLLAETIGMLDAVDANLLAIDREQRCAFVSISTAQLLGYQLHELLGKKLTDLPAFGNLEKALLEPASSNSGKRAILKSGALQSRDGHFIPVQFSHTPLVVAEQFVGIVVTIIDLTEQRRAEEALTRLASIEDSVDEAIIIHTGDGIISSWNRAAERIYGYVEEEVVGRHISIIHPPGYKPELQSLFDRVLQRQRIEPFETVRIRKGGERVFVSINPVLLNETANEPPCLAQIVTDLTALKKAEEAALQAKSSELTRRRAVRAVADVTSALNGSMGTTTPLASRITAKTRNSVGPTLIGRSPLMQKLFTTIDRVALTDNSVLITGQTGTGKELVARAIHNKSRRAGGPFIDLNCSAIPETLIEAELFGHQRGTFTGAHENRVGLFEAASGGTLFLDEVDALPLAAQAKLLRVLQEKRIRRVGGRTNIEVDVRILSATNSDLNVAIKEGRFRSDLFYRLRVFPVDVPALNQRGNDVEMLIDYFLERHADLYGTGTRSFTPSAMDALLNYAWPGNVRELESAVEYALAVGTDEKLGLEDLPVEFSAHAHARNPAAQFQNDGAPLAEIEKRYILSVLQQFQGNQVRAAAALGIDRSKLYRRLRQYGIKAVKFLQEERGDGMQLLSSHIGETHESESAGNIDQHEIASAT